MRQITLRDIPEDIEKVVRSEAGERGISLNKAFLSLLKKGARQAPSLLRGEKKAREDRFSRFCGVWSDDEAREFEAILDEQRTIDGELWQ